MFSSLTCLTNDIYHVAAGFLYNFGQKYEPLSIVDEHNMEECWVKIIKKIIIMIIFCAEVDEASSYLMFASLRKFNNFNMEYLARLRTTRVWYKAWVDLSLKSKSHGSLQTLKCRKWSFWTRLALT